MDKRSSIIYLFILFIGLTNAHFVEETHEYTNSTIRRKRQDISKCAVPQYKSHERWLLGGNIIPPGTELEVNTLVTIECQEGYRVNTKSNLLACDSNWRPEVLPKCEKLCQKFYSTATTTVVCKDSLNNHVPCDTAIDDTRLEYICSPFHEPTYERTINYCVKGEWTYPKPDCQPVCGKKVTNKTLVLSYGGRQLKGFEYPWVTALYLNRSEIFENVCGGSLVSRKVVLTAAHCVINEFGSQFPKEKIEVAAGKLFNPYRDPRDIKFAQYRKVYNLTVHPAYRGESQIYAGDLAIIIVDMAFIFGEFVQPVCINNVNNIPLISNQMGEVAGWGITEEERASDRLRVIKIPYKDRATCSAELPREWEEKYNFIDKICAGYYKQNISVCQGDSGSGLVFQNRQNKNRYYLHGIVSIAPNLFNAQCNYEQNALYTSVANYFDFIDAELQKNYVEDCVLPPKPENGNWVLVNEADLQPNDKVLSTTVLSFTCNSGYKLSPPTPLLRCQNTYVPPTCNQMCEDLIFPKDTQVYCRNRADQVTNCEDATDGWSVTYTCPIGFETEQKMTSSTKYCIRGVYGRPKPSCHLIGTVPDDEQTKPGKTESSDQKVICTYASWWAYKGIYPEDLQPKLCTHVVYASVGISDNGELRVQDDELELDEDSRGLYHRVTDMKKRNRLLKVILSVGGPLASNASLFSSISRQTAKTVAFVKSAVYFIKTYSFDGLDIDWQYPLESEKDNYITFLQTIKDEFQRNGWSLSASVRSDLDGTGYNVAAMNRILDWITIKSYDFYTGASSKYTGIHNALYASSKENDWEKSHLNMDSVAKNWLKAGLTKGKLILSIAFYGRSFKLKSSGEHGIHASVTGPGPGVDNGFLRYYEICSKYTTNYDEEWDNDSRAPYRFSNNIWIGFNSNDAVWTKGEYIKKNGYGGINVYPWDGDDNKGLCGMKHILLKHIHGGLGNTKLWETNY